MADPASTPSRSWWSRPRSVLWLGLVLAAGVLLAGCDLDDLTVTVTTTADGNDATPGNGVCEMTDGAGDCSLRAAIDEANALPGTLVQVALPPGTYELTEPGIDDTNAGGDLDLQGSALLVGTGPGVIIDGNGIDRVLDSSDLLGLAELTVTGGATSGDGGGVRILAGTLLASRTTVAANSAGGNGGGVAVVEGVGYLGESTVNGNTAGAAGGGAHNATGTTLTFHASTISGNTVDPTIHEPAGPEGPSAAPGGSQGPPDAPAVDASPVDDPGSLAPGGPGSPELAAPTTADGSIPVIVELAVPTAPESDLNPGAIGRQRAAIARAQQGLTQALGPGARATRRYTALPYLAAAVPPEQLAALQARADVRAVHPDELTPLALAQSIPWIGADIVHGAGVTGSGAVVAVLDTGVDASHLMLSGKVVAEACFATGVSSGDGNIGDCPNGTPTQTGAGSGTPCAWASLGCGHGTHVASIAAGSPVNQGPNVLEGVAPAADIISIQVFSRVTSNCAGGASQCIASYASDQVAALDHVYTLRTAHDIAAVNMSLAGSRFYAPCDTDSRAPAIGALRSAGIATVIASGNNGYKDSVSRPGCISAAITVGATSDSADTVANFSNSDDVLDLLAPGVSITAASPGNLLATMNGTSMATPHVAGAVAVLHALDPDATVDDIEALLEGTGVPVTDTNGLTRSRVDLAAAVGAAGGPGHGGGIASDGHLALDVSTVTGNAAPWVGGVAVTGTADLISSIVASQADGSDCGGTFTSAGWNLDSDGSCGLGGTGDVSGVDPLLGPLTDNGGSTDTHLPSAGSPAVDSVPFGSVGRCDAATRPDQRNVARPQGPACDRGAVERQ